MGISYLRPPQGRASTGRGGGSGAGRHAGANSPRLGCRSARTRISFPASPDRI